MPKSWWKWLLTYFLFILGYVLFSYSLTAPNLVLSSNAWYWQFQTWMWETLFNNRSLLTWSYGVIILGLVGSWAGLVRSLWKNQALRSKSSSPLFIFKIFLLLSLPLLLANNALSYDVFNYIFNAKMVLTYHANPHVQVALDFAQDDWTRFMHNTHTPAPYGYGWTALSLLPYLLGMGKFILVWFSFSVFSWLSLALIILIIIKLHQQIFKRAISVWQMSLVFLNPLVLIEIIGNSHNDLWMMLPVLLAIYLLFNLSQSKFKKLSQIIVSAALLCFSISTKLASIILIPIWALVLFRDKISQVKIGKFIASNWAFWASGLMFAPLLISRSQQFHPWYLTWSLVFLPLIPTKIEIKWREKSLNVAYLWKVWLIALSMSSLLRYIPYLWAGTFEGSVLTHQKMITWLGGVIISLIWLAYSSLQKKAD